MGHDNGMCQNGTTAHSPVIWGQCHLVPEEHMALLLSKTRSDHNVNNPRQVVTEQRKSLSYQDILTSRTLRILWGNKKLMMLFWHYFETSQENDTHSSHSFIYLFIYPLIYSYIFVTVCYVPFYPFYPFHSGQFHWNWGNDALVPVI